MLEIKLTSGPRNASTNAETGLRYYEWQGRKLPSTTTLRRMAGLPFRLHQWTVSKVVERAVTEYPLMVQMMERPKRPRERVRDKNVQKETARWLRSAGTEERDSAAELGTLVHDLAIKRLPLSQVDPDAAPFVAQFYDWLRASGVNIIAVEQQVWNLTVGYAGTFDLLAEWPDGMIDVIDLKTGRSTYTDHALQLVSYALAEFVGADNVVDVPLTKALHAATSMSLLHLAEDGWTYQRVPATTELFRAFRGLCTFATWASEHMDIGSVTDYEAKGGVAYP
jgi:hypothetical protein